MIDWRSAPPAWVFLAHQFEGAAHRLHEKGVTMDELAGALTLLGIDLEIRRVGTAAAVGWLRQIADEIEGGALASGEQTH